MSRRKHFYSQSKSAGQLAAEKHIREAAELSEELGGTDEDVKKYFLCLSGPQLAKVMDEYEMTYGARAKSYALAAIPHWRDGSRKMSGLVASRLFSFLPRHMPLNVKYSLVESLWNHSSPRSTITYYCGPKSTFQSVSNVVLKRFSEVLSPHTIPENIERRFEWLSQGDAKMKQQLLNHFRYLEKRLLEDALNHKIPLLLKTFFGSGSASLSVSGQEVLIIGKHSVRLEFLSYAQELDVSEMKPKEPSRPQDYWLVWAILGAIIFFFLASE